MGTERRPDEVSTLIGLNFKKRKERNTGLSLCEQPSSCVAGWNEDVHPLALLEEDVQGEGPAGRDL